MASTLLAGSLAPKRPLGTLICWSEVLAGLALLPLLVRSPWAAILAMALHGFFTAPLTVWALTLRMEFIPPPLRGRTFALLRMLIQGAGPAGSLLAGMLLPLVGLRVMVVLAAAIAGGGSCRLPGADATHRWPTRQTG